MKQETPAERSAGVFCTCKQRYDPAMLGEMQFKGTWRDYQARVLDEFEQHFGDERLHIVAAPGAGKTVLGLEIIRRIGRPALVFAPTIAIREQWEQRLYPLFLDRPPASEAISRSLSAPAELTLTTYQALDSIRRGEELEALIAHLDGLGPITLMLDEAHHLRREWWHCLIRLTEGLSNVRIVALTATPPYDAGLAEWNRYEQLCGPIDLEIGIPELVRNGDLCPHQDHLILSEPTAETLALLSARRVGIAQVQAELRSDNALLDWFAGHPWLTTPEAHVEEILDAPEMLSAVMVLLASAGRDLPKPPLRLLGVAARDIPAPSPFWLERLLDGLLFQHTAQFPLERTQTTNLRNRLHRLGLIEGQRVRLRHTRSVFRLMTASLAKLESIAMIARAEREALGDDLRMVILSDHIRAGELPVRADAEFRPAKLGVVPVFERLRREGATGQRIGVLTGSLVILPLSAVPAIMPTAQAVRLDPHLFRTTELPGCPDHVRLDCSGGGSAALVQLVTALFVAGHVQILIGTQSLLGEGWDAPALNSLVLASNAASFMLSNQMRGRAIRIDPHRPGKVSNIWHLATIDPMDDDLGEAAASFLDWGYLGQGDSGGWSDLAVVARRFEAFEGIANGSSSLIEDGLARLGLDTAGPSQSANSRTFACAADRPAIAARWAASLGEGKENARVRETAAPRHAPRSLSWFDTLHALTWSGLAGGAFGAASELHQVPGAADLGALGMALSGAAVLATLPRLARAGLLVWRSGTLESSLAQVTMVVLRALVDADLVNGTELDHAEAEIRTSLDGRKDIVLTGVSHATERLVMQAIAEILGPVQNPRYLLVRSSWMGPRKRIDFHAVPTVLGARKEHAERFAALWESRVGSSKLVFTRTAEGRRLLLKARARSFAAGFQRAVDRRSVWL